MVDGRKVEASDLGTNFFVTLKSVGESRARVVTELLGELNEYVKGNYVEEVCEEHLSRIRGTNAQMVCAGAGPGRAGGEETRLCYQIYSSHHIKPAGYVWLPLLCFFCALC